MSNLKKNMGSLEYSEYLSTPIYDDDGNELWYCSFHEEHEPRNCFYASKTTARGFQTYCKDAQKVYNGRVDSISNSNLPDKHLATQILKRLGYDTESDIPIHVQFEQRHKKNI